MKDTKEFLKFIFSFANALNKSLEDGKINFMDVGNFVSMFGTIGPAVEDISKIGHELVNLSAESRLELVEYIQIEFNIDNDKVEQVVEQSLIVALNIIPLIMAIKSL